MLKVDKIKVGYKGIPVIHDVSFEVRENQIVAILGANGAGKTTALKTVIGLLKPSEGSVIYDGKNITGMPANRIISMGMAMVLEGRHLFSRMSIVDNLLMGAYTIKDKYTVQKNLEQVYEIFPILKERYRQMAGTMSGGEQQMVAIGRALMSSPRLLILDEPSLGLMPKLVNEVFELIRKINKLGITIIIVEQNAKQTLQFADYAYVIANGKSVLGGTGQEFLNDDRIQKVYLGI